MIVSAGAYQGDPNPLKHPEWPEVYARVKFIDSYRAPAERLELVAHESHVVQDAINIEIDLPPGQRLIVHVNDSEVLDITAPD